MVQLKKKHTECVHFSLSHWSSFRCVTSEISSFKGAGRCRSLCSWQRAPPASALAHATLLLGESRVAVGTGMPRVSGLWECWKWQYRDVIRTDRVGPPRWTHHATLRVCVSVCHVFDRTCPFHTLFHLLLTAGHESCLRFLHLFSRSSEHTSQRGDSFEKSKIFLNNFTKSLVSALFPTCYF